MNATTTAKYPSRQKGLSLIGLLIGLLISVLCILASLTLYKNLIKVATESKLDSDHDGQLASAMLMIQLEVQSAGYGIPGATLSHIVKHEPAGVRQLLWRFTTDNGTTYQCRGLREESADGGQFRVLKLIKVDSGCNSTAALNSFTWNATNPIATLGRWRVVADGVSGVGLDDYISSKTHMFNFDVGNAACNPYGANSAATENRGFLTVTVPGSAFLQGAAGMTATEYKYCLPNIYPASP